MKVKTDKPCGCGCHEFEVHEEDRGYIGSMAVSETVAVCKKCGKTIYQSDFSKMFKDGQ